MKKTVKEFIKRVFLLLNLMVMNMSFVLTAFATESEKKEDSGNKLLNSKPVKGLFNLISDVQGVLLAVEAVVIVVLLIWVKIKEQSSEEEEKPKYKKQFKGIIVTGITIVSLTALVPLILSYFA